MHYKLLGFSHIGSLRQFLFERVANGVAPIQYTVLADVMIARKFNLSLQQLPALCARLLQEAGEDQPAGLLLLTEADMSIYAAENAAAAAEQAAGSAMRSHRGSLAMAARTERKRPVG